MTLPQNRKIGEMLRMCGLISHAELLEALRFQRERGGRLVRALVLLGHLEPQVFAQFLAKEMRLPCIELCRYEVSDEVLSLVPWEFVLGREVMPLERLKQVLTAAMVCPLDTATVNELHGLTGLQIRPILCTASDLRRSAQRYYADLYWGETGYTSLTDVGHPPATPTQETADQLERAAYAH